MAQATGATTDNATDAEDSIDGSLGKAREDDLDWDPDEKFRKYEDNDSNGYSLMADQIKQSRRKAGSRDEALVNLLMDIADEDASLNMS